jgi:plastocyanin
MRTWLAILAALAVGAAELPLARDSALPPAAAVRTVTQDWGTVSDEPLILWTARLFWPAMPAAAQTTTRLPGSIRGRVDVRKVAIAPERRPGVGTLSTPGPREIPDLRRAVVFLESAPSGAFDDREPTRARMDQRNETFFPHVLAVTTGTTVDFPNNDSTYHNVFSLSKPRRFDLGRYARGKSKPVRFDRPGIVRVFCDIHSHMSAFIVVFSHPYHATTDPDGRYRIDNLPPGTYTVSAWYEGETRDSRSVTIPPQGGAVDLDLLVQ